MKLQSRLRLVLSGTVVGLTIVVVIALSLVLRAGANAAISQLSQSIAQEASSEGLATTLKLAGQFSVLVGEPFYYFDYRKINDTLDTAMSMPEIVSIAIFDFDQVIHEDTGVRPEFLLPLIEVGLITLDKTKLGLTQYNQNSSLTTVFVPVMYQGDILGGLKLVSSAINVEQDIALMVDAVRIEFNQIVWLFVAILLIIVFGIYLPLSTYIQHRVLRKTVIEPILILSEFAKNPDALKEDPSKLLDRGDEIASLAKSLHGMYQSLDARAKEIEYIAYHDALTGLPNRTSILVLIQEWIEDAKAKDEKFAVYSINIDGMKSINQMLGHQIGDDLIARVGERISATMKGHRRRPKPIIGRASGDEYLMAAMVYGRDEAAVIAQQILDDMAEPFLIGGVTMPLTVSMGATIYPDDGLDLPQLAKNIGLTQLAAKSAGTGNFALFNESLAVAEQRKLLILKELELCIEHNDIQVFYQPVVNLKTNEIAGAEALARWIHPELGFIPPDEFIPLAEQHQLILPLSAQIIDKACEQRLAWSHVAPPEFSIAINISPLQLISEENYGVISDTMHKYGLDPRQIDIEITETAFIGDEEKVFKALESFRAQGHAVWLDDFGTGFSSLSHLQQYPVDGIKIDRSFVSDIVSNSKNLTLVAALADLGLKMGKEVVAEGIETQIEQTILQRLGATYGQGYHIGRPVKAQDFENSFFSKK